jgi:hypothetical protein
MSPSFSGNLHEIAHRIGRAPGGRSGQSEARNVIPSFATATFANYDNNQHAEDENLRLGNPWRAIDVATAIMQMR